jgi:hypothetical protein
LQTHAGSSPASFEPLSDSIALLADRLTGDVPSRVRRHSSAAEVYLIGVEHGRREEWAS